MQSPVARMMIPQGSTLPKTDRLFRSWLRALPPGRKLHAMMYSKCAIGQFAKSRGLDLSAAIAFPMPAWADKAECMLFQATRHLGYLGKDRTITAKEYRKFIGMREPAAV